MRAAVHVMGRETIFHTFDGFDWIESGRTLWGDLSPNGWVCAGGDAVILTSFTANSNTRHKVYDGAGLVCEVMRPFTDISPIYAFYESGRLVFLYTDFSSLLSCGTTHRWVNAGTQLGDSLGHSAFYRDGRVYMQNTTDGYVETDIPTHLVRVCDEGEDVRIIGTHMGTIYAMGAYEPTRLWCRDMRAPLPFSIPIGATTDRADGRIVTSDGLILMAGRVATMRIIDIRSTDLWYEISTESLLKKAPYVSLPPY